MVSITKKCIKSIIVLSVLIGPNNLNIGTTLKNEVVGVKNVMSRLVL